MTIIETNPASRNGVDTATLFATLDAVKQARPPVTNGVPVDIAVDVA